MEVMIDVTQHGWAVRRLGSEPSAYFPAAGGRQAAEDYAAELEKIPPPLPDNPTAAELARSWQFCHETTLTLAELGDWLKSLPSPPMPEEYAMWRHDPAGIAKAQRAWDADRKRKR